MKDNRSLVKYLLLNILSVGLYGLYYWSQFAHDMNIVCDGDGLKTRGTISRILLNILTLGSYKLIWLHGVGNRLAANCRKKGIEANITGGKVVAWYTIGLLLFGIGPLVAISKLMKGMNALCTAYNRDRHTAQMPATVNVNILGKAS